MSDTTLDPRVLYASPQPANPAQMTDAMTPESYVADYIAHGGRSILPLPAWEKAYQDAGLIDEAQKLGYIWIGRDVACTIEVTPHGRTAAELHSTRAALTAAIGAGGQAVAEAREHDIKALIKLAGECQLVDGVTLYDRSLLKSLANFLEETLSQPHPADERVVEVLREARELLAGPLVGVEWKRACHSFIAKADAVLSGSGAGGWRKATGSRPSGLNDDDVVQTRRHEEVLGNFTVKNFNWDLWCDYRVLPAATAVTGGR